MDDYYRPRSRSQSRRPGQEEEHFVPIDRSHRSKSLDNRRFEFQRGDHDADPSFYDPPGGGGGFRDTFHASIPRRHYERRFGGDGGDGDRRGGGGGDDFFNESITIPRSTVKVSPTRMDQDKNEHNWTSYDKSTRWHHEHTAHPAPPAPPQYPQQQYYRYDEHYGTGGGGGGGGNRAEISPRSFPESDYYQRTQIQRPTYYDERRSQDAASAYRTEQQRYYEEQERAERERSEKLLREQRELEERSRREAHAVAAKNGKNGHGAGGYSYQASGYSRGGWRGGGRGGRGGKPDRQYHRVTCCCFRFYWPPWGYEPVEPVQPWYPRPTTPRSGSPVPPPIEKQPR